MEGIAKIEVSKGDNCIEIKKKYNAKSKICFLEKKLDYHGLFA